MEKIPTAEDFLIEAGFPGHAKHGLAKKWMIEFAKLHVQQALEEASKKAYITYHENRGDEIIDKDSILNSYPLDKIK